jgi:hypothetical protein
MSVSNTATKLLNERALTAIIQLTRVMTDLGLVHWETRSAMLVSMVFGPAVIPLPSSQVVDNVLGDDDDSSASAEGST